MLSATLYSSRKHKAVSFEVGRNVMYFVSLRYFD